MQRPWTQFATNYADKGNPKSSSMYPNMSMSYPSYNRSPAPFHSMSYEQPPVSHHQESHPQNSFQQQQMIYQQPQHQELSYQQPQTSYQEQHQPQQSHYSQSEQWDRHQIPQEHMEQEQYQQYHNQPGCDLQISSQRVKNIREDPDFDENFPSYRELRKVFVDKQRDANREERQSRSQFMRGDRRVFNKPPSHQVSKRPPLSPTRPVRDVPDHQAVHRPVNINQSRASKQTLNMSASPQKPRRLFSQVSQERGQNEGYYKPDQPISPRRRSSSLGRRPSNRYQEMPVSNINNNPAASWQHIKPQREAVRHKVPISIHIPTADEGSPKVRITSNSPRSPQKATYIPDGNEDTIYHQPSFVQHKSPSTVISMNGNANLPRRRRSYAEVLITHNSLPRNFTTRPAYSQQVSREDSSASGDAEWFQQQNRYNPSGGARTPMQTEQSSSYQSSSTWEQGSTTTAQGRVRHPSMNQMLYATSPNTQQQGWNYQPMINGPHVVHTPNKAHPGYIQTSMF